MRLTMFGTLSDEAIGLLQRALNALNRGESDVEVLAVDRRFGKRTRAALVRFLAGSGAPGEARLVKAILALRGVR